MLLSKKEISQILKLVPKREEMIAGYIPSAILMLFFNRDEQTNLVYIRRTKGMRIHSGHMAFPGGKVDAVDESSYATAVRETYEEIGVDERQYTHLGDMGLFETLTSAYDAVAHLACCHKPPVYKKNDNEVQEIIEIPLEILFEQFRPDLDYQNRDELMYLNFRYQPPSSTKAANRWGLTARITHHFLQGLAQHIK